MDSRVKVIHLATIDLEVEGQAFSWAQDGSRTVFTSDRGKGLVRSIAVPDVPIQRPRPPCASAGAPQLAYLFYDGTRTPATDEMSRCSKPQM